MMTNVCKIARVYSSSMNSGILFTDEQPICEICQQQKPKVKWIVSWLRRRREDNVFCIDCYTKIKKKVHRGAGVITENKIVLCVDKLPEDVVPYNHSFPGLRESEHSLFEAVSQKVAPADKVIDRTNHVHNPNFMKDLEYKPYDIVALEHHDKEMKAMSTDNGLKLLDMIAKAKPALPDGDKDKLEDKR
jgi:hypothetical protein